MNTFVYIWIGLSVLATAWRTVRWVLRWSWQRKKKSRKYKEEQRLAQEKTSREHYVRICQRINSQLDELMAVTQASGLRCCYRLIKDAVYGKDLQEISIETLQKFVNLAINVLDGGITDFRRVREQLDLMGFHTSPMAKMN